MSRPRILHLADLHLGASHEYAGDRAAERSQRAEKAFAEALDFAANPSNHIDAVIIAGDLFDRHNPPTDLMIRTEERMQKLTASLPVVLIPGTHDGILYQDSIFRQRTDFGNAHLIMQTKIGSPLTLKLRDAPVHFYGMAFDYNAPKPFDTFHATDDEGIHIAILHGSLEGNPDWDVESRYIPLNGENLGKTGMDYIALGHYHNFWEKDFNGVKVVYPGTLEGKKWSETGTRYLVVVDFSSGKPSLEHKPWNHQTIQRATLDLTNQAVTSDEMLAHLIRDKYGDENRILRLSVTGAIDFVPDWESVTAQARSPFYHLELLDRTSLLDSDRVKEITKEKTVRGLFVRKIMAQMEGADASLQKRLQGALKEVMARLVAHEDLS